jgi:hypothetical protein
VNRHGLGRMCATPSRRAGQDERARGGRTDEGGR